VFENEFLRIITGDKRTLNMKSIELLCDLHYLSVPSRQIRKYLTIGRLNKSVEIKIQISLMG
jgi:hypothetical protein